MDLDSILRADGGDDVCGVRGWLIHIFAREAQDKMEAFAPLASFGCIVCSSFFIFSQ